MNGALRLDEGLLPALILATEQAAGNRRRGAALRLPDAAIGAVAEIIDRTPAVVQSRLSLRNVNRMLARVEDLASRPTLH